MLLEMWGEQFQVNIIERMARVVQDHDLVMLQAPRECLCISRDRSGIRITDAEQYGTFDASDRGIVK